MYFKQVEVAPLANYSYIIGSEVERTVAVIDPGADILPVLSIIDSDDLKVKFIINTHGHIDHIAGNADVAESTDAPIAVHYADADLVRNMSDQPYAAQIARQPSPEPSILFRDEHIFQVGEVTLEVIHTPGHSPGSCCLRLFDRVFTGDTLFVGGIGRTDLPGGDYATLLQSINKRLLALPDETLVFPGHKYGAKPWSTIGEEKRTNPFLQQ